jgi:isopentenyldiphosphate isomerase
MNTEPQNEMLPVVDETGKVIGQATRSECHSNPKLIHPVIHLHVFNSAGGLYLQKRAQSKDLFPGYWDTSVGGHVGLGESADRALEREASEELGMDAAGAKLIARYVWHNEFETEYTYTYYILYDGPITPDKLEIDEGSFFSKTRINEKLGLGFFTPNFEKEFVSLHDFFDNFLR